jgi:hypothetical protein
MLVNIMHYAYRDFGKPVFGSPFQWKLWLDYVEDLFQAFCKNRLEPMGGFRFAT